MVLKREIVGKVVQTMATVTEIIKETIVKLRKISVNPTLRNAKSPIKVLLQV